MIGCLEVSCIRYNTLNCYFFDLNVSEVVVIDKNMLNCYVFDLNLIIYLSNFNF